MKKYILFLFTAIVMSGCTNAQTSNEGSSSLPATEFAEKIKATENSTILDVRTPGEFEKGHLENAVNIDWNGNDFDLRISELDKSKTIFVYCLSGGRSHGAAEKMRQSGFAKVIEMAGGMMEWRANSLPETRLSSMEKGMSLEQYQALLQSDKLVLVDFYATWCAPCKKMKPYLEKMAVEMDAKLLLVRVDADENAELCKQLNVAALPVLKLYKNNALVWEHTGYLEEEEVRTQIGKYEK